MSDESSINIEKIFSFYLLDEIRFFIFNNNGKKCWISTRDKKGKYTAREAVAEDWMFIGGEISDGFKNCDFSGCDFSKFDISGTKFVNCKFSCGVFDYSFVSYENMFDCKFI